MFKKLKFNGRITHKGNFCQCTRTTYHGTKKINTMTENLDNAEYKALLYSLMVEEDKQVDKWYFAKNYTIAGNMITDFIQITNGTRFEYKFSKFNIPAMS